MRKRESATARDMDTVEVVDVDEQDEEEEEEEKECEDWCFVCKDGGSLMICDYKDCPKVYHASCVEKDISVRKNEESLICKWHSCYLCSKRPKLYCLCCPHAVCEGCVTHADFIHLKDNKGLCNHCQEYVVAIEEIREYDAAGDKIDLTDRDTFECLFLEYWEIIKNQEEITFEDVRASKSRKKGVKSRHKDDPMFELNGFHSSKSRKKDTKLKDKDDPKFSLTDHAAEDAEDYKTTVKTKRLEFNGWGSTALIDFLTSIGEDTKEKMSQYSVESVIRRYIRQNNLLDDEKKKKVRCDEKLYSIFRKNYVNQKRIHTLLNGHFKENIDQADYITLLERGFGEKNEKVSVPCKKLKTDAEDEETCEMEVKTEMRSTGLAKINADNIKLVYLRKSLVVELLKQNESSENKVVGSFVKVKNDPRDRMAYQILQVTGIKTADDQNMFLYVAGIADDVSVSRLDDSDLSKEEIDDLKKKVMSGLLRQPTVAEMEQKAKDLHEDITKHWIARQLIILQKRINYANEKGWRKELDEYLEERELLQNPSEQEKLLRRTPKIVEDFIEIKPEPGASSDSSKQGNISGLTQEEKLLRRTPKIVEDFIEIKPEPAASSDSSKQGNISGLTQEVVMIDLD